MTPAEQFAAQASQWQAAGRLDMAAQLYAASLDHDPSNAALRFQLAECLVYLRRPDEAAKHYLQVAQAHAAIGRRRDCLSVCDRIIQVAPHAFVYTAVGPMVRRIGRDARTVCARSAEAHLRAGQQTEGLQILRLATELDADGPEVRLQLARIYKSRHMTREAVEAMADAGDLLLRAKRVRDYTKVAELLLTLDPDHLDTLRDLPRAYLELGRPHDAVRMLGQLTRVNRGDVVGYEILAHAFAYLGHTDKSLQVLERLVDELGAIGRGNKADAILERARDWCPSDLGFLRSLKRMEIPKIAPSRPAAPAPRDIPPEGTVVLSIADLISDQTSAGQSPAAQSDGIELIEAEGSLTLRLGPQVREEAQRAHEERVAAGAPPPAPAPSSQTPMPGPDDIEISMSMDASDLIAALANDPSWDAISGVLADEGDDDSADNDERPTALEMKALTTGDIARARQGVHAEAPASAPAPRRHVGPPRPPPPPPPPPPAPPPAAAPPAPAPDVEGEDAPTMARMSALTAADIAKALGSAGEAAPSRAPQPSLEDETTLSTRARVPASAVPVDDEEAMTITKAKALTPEDIARARRRQRK